MMGMEKAMERIHALATNHFALLPEHDIYFLVIMRSEKRIAEVNSFG